MQVGFFCEIKSPLLSCSNMGMFLVKNSFPFSIVFRTVLLHQCSESPPPKKESREGSGRKAVVLYWQASIMPELRWNLPRTERRSFYMYAFFIHQSEIIAVRRCGGVQNLALGLVLLLALGWEPAVWHCGLCWAAGTPSRVRGLWCGTAGKTSVWWQYIEAGFVLVVLRFMHELANKDLA